MRTPLLYTTLLLLPACSAGIPLAPYAQATATPYHFDLCHGYSCTYKSPVHLNAADWRAIAAHFTPPAPDATTERTQIAAAISMLERLSQENAKLNPDEAKAENFESDQDQMDCIDETINTNRYLEFLASQNLLKFHEVSHPISRGVFIDGIWPHNTAAVRDTYTDKIYAIDSYYESSGGPVHVVEKSVWLDNWRPQKSTRTER